MKLSETEQQLVRGLLIETTILIAENLCTENTQKKSNLKNCAVRHYFISTYEQAFEVLQIFEILSRLEGDHANILMDKDQILALNLFDFDVSFYEILKAFIGMTLKQNDIKIIPCTRNPFSVATKYTYVMELFVETGYVEPVEEQYKWTDKIASVMIGLELWRDNNRAKSDIMFENLNYLLDTMPSEFKNSIFDNEKVDIKLLYTTILKHWYDDKIIKNEKISTRQMNCKWQDSEIGKVEQLDHIQRNAVQIVEKLIARQFSGSNFSLVIDGRPANGKISIGNNNVWFS